MVNMKLTGLLGLALDCLIGMNVKMLGLLTRKTGTDVCGEHETDRPVRHSLDCLIGMNVKLLCLLGLARLTGFSKV